MYRSLVARLIAGILFLVGCWIAYIQKQIGPAPQLTLRQIKDNLYEIEGHGGNVGVYVTGEGVILVDDMYEQDFAAINSKVRSLTPLPVKYVLSTHHHADHSGGNTRFLPVAEILSTENARANIAGNPVNAPPGPFTRVYELGQRLFLPPRPWRSHIRLLPARVVFTQEAAVFLGGNEVRAYSFGRGHTNGDAVIYFPALRTLHAGDLMENDMPYIDYKSGGSVVEWVKTLDKVMQLDFETVIPGHGPVTDKAGLLAYRNTVEKLYTRAAELIRAGRSQEEVGKAMIAEFHWDPTGPQMTLSLPGMMAELK